MSDHRNLAFVCSLLTTTLLSPLPIEAASINFAGMVPGAGTVKKQVVSMREKRYENIVTQQTDFSCGAAALATILKYAYSQDQITEQEVLAGMFKVSDQELVMNKGFSLLDIKRYVESRGMRGRGYKVGIEKLQLVKIPTIILLDIKGYKHFAVLNKVENGLAYVADPALGNKHMPIDQFLDSWNGVVFAVIGGNFDRYSVLLNPEDPLTMRERKTDFTPLTDQQLLDFGFIHADLL